MIIYKSNYLIAFMNFYYEVHKCTQDVEVGACPHIYFRIDLRRGTNNIFSRWPAHNAIEMEA
jgi:hypothetical protein